MPTIVLHRFIDGPFEGDDGLWYNLCLIEYENGEVLIEEVTFESLDDALKTKETLTTTLYALEVEADLCSTTSQS